MFFAVPWRSSVALLRQLKEDKGAKNKCCRVNSVLDKSSRVGLRVIARPRYILKLFYYIDIKNNYKLRYSISVRLLGTNIEHT